MTLTLQLFVRWPAGLVLAAALSLSACATRPTAAVLQPASATGGAQQITILSATDRTKDKTAQGYDSGRGRAMTYERYTVSIPPTHKSSAIEWPKGQPNAATDFVVTKRKELDKADFAAAAGKPSEDGTVGLFVHGYNYTFQESLYRLAQVAADGRAAGTPVLFSWPSEGALTGYVADKDAVLYSREDLAALITTMARAKGVKRVVVFGHSMGGFLIMEALRQLKLEGREDILNKAVVALAAPDIDTDVFRKQLETIGPMANPLTLFVSKDDKALAVSSFLGGERQRAGRLDVDDPVVEETAQKFKIRVVDITSLKDVEGLGHDRFATLAGVGPQLAALEGNGASSPKVGAFVFDTAAAVVSSPFRLAGRVVSGQ